MVMGYGPAKQQRKEDEGCLATILAYIDSDTIFIYKEATVRGRSFVHLNRPCILQQVQANTSTLTYV